MVNFCTLELEHHRRVDLSYPRLTMMAFLLSAHTEKLAATAQIGASVMMQSLGSLSKKTMFLCLLLPVSRPPTASTSSFVFRGEDTGSLAGLGAFADVEGFLVVAFVGSGNFSLVPVPGADAVGNSLDGFETE